MSHSQPILLSESINYSNKGRIEVDMRMAFVMKLWFDDKKTDWKVNNVVFVREELVPLQVTQDSLHHFEEKCYCWMIAKNNRIFCHSNGSSDIGHWKSRFSMTGLDFIYTRNWLSICINLETNQKHQSGCLNHQPVLSNLPKLGKNVQTFCSWMLQSTSVLLRLGIAHATIKSLLQPVNH